MAPYAYETPNSELIRDLKLQVHPEGGYFAETHRATETILTPFGEGTVEERKRGLQTTTYYLLTPDQPHNYVHMNKSGTMHLLHQGRAEYILIHPPSSSSTRSLPRVERVILGPHTSRGEVRQLYVGTGIWKTSRLLEGDVQSGEDAERIGCLTSQVVVPGFEWVDYEWMRQSDLDALYPPADPAAAAAAAAIADGSGNSSEDEEDEWVRMRQELQRLIRPE
ncbi:hypothetical protein CPB86DRAFT_780475 [Serendipita vermifera]|nr:hypothetical protein CPB86DRAFT_780475 [Serendipita vermifera]